MILVVGEALVDVVDGVAHAGGGPANVAVGLGRLGLDVTLATTLGEDPNGDLVRRHLATASVAVHTAPADRTSTAEAQIGDDGAAGYRFDLTWAPGAIEPPTGVTAVHAGSVAATLAPGADDVERLVRTLRPTATISLDPNVRPALVADRSDAVARIDRLAALADVVKVSDEDLAWLRPGEPLEQAARRWLTDGPALVVVTRGSHGATAYTASDTVEVDPVPTDVVDTVGAGDAFMSGLLAAMHAGGLLDVMRRAELHTIDASTVRRLTDVAARSAALTVGRAGADPPNRGELDV